MQALGEMIAYVSFKNYLYINAFRIERKKEVYLHSLCKYREPQLILPGVNKSVLKMDPNRATLLFTLFHPALCILFAH